MLSTGKKYTEAQMTDRVDDLGQNLLVVSK